MEKGATDLNNAMYWAAAAGHKDLVYLLVERGANNWFVGLDGAKHGKDTELIEYFKKKIGK